MTAHGNSSPPPDVSETTDTLFRRLRALERRAAPAEDFRRMIEDFLRQEPAVAAALPEFSAFGLLEALRNARNAVPLVEIGRYAATSADAIALMHRLSEEDVSLCHPWHSPNHPRFPTVMGVFAGLFFGIATPGNFGAALVVGLLGALCGFVAAALVRFQIRNSTQRWERPQWICALHVDRYLQAYARGFPLTGLQLEDLPNPGFRHKAPFYDLHNQITAGPHWTYHRTLRDTPELTFAPITASSLDR